MPRVNWEKIKLDIINYSKIIKIDKIGFTVAEPFLDIEQLLLEHREKGYNSGFEEKDIKLRIDPKLSLPSARSIIAIAIAYPSRKPKQIIDNKIRGKFCRASWGKDYHFVLKEKLSKLSCFIKKLVPEAEMEMMIDTGPLSDRAVAARAGLGWIGKNSNLITPEFGSFVFLGELLTNLPLIPDKPINNNCEKCTRCLDACPMQAILPEKSVINSQKCLAYQTLTKGFLSDELKEKIASQKYIYGCDICQLACPYNQNKHNDWHEGFKPDYELVSPALNDLLKITNKQFKRKYGHMSGSWRGKKNLERNAILILGEERDIKMIPLLKELFLNDSRPEIRGVAAWSLGKFPLVSTKEILTKGLVQEKDAQVIKEIKKALVEVTTMTNGKKL